MLLFKFLTFLNLIFLINSLSLSKRVSLADESGAEAEIESRSESVSNFESGAEAEIESRSESVSNIENGLKSKKIGDLDNSDGVRRMLKSVKDKCAVVIAKIDREDLSTEKEVDTSYFGDCINPMLDFASKNEDNELNHQIIYDCTLFPLSERQALCADPSKRNSSHDFVSTLCNEYLKQFDTFKDSKQQELGEQVCKKVCKNLSNKFTSDLNCTCFKGETEEKENSFTFPIGKKFSVCDNLKEIDQIFKDNKNQRFLKSHKKDKKRSSSTSKPITVWN